jgi:hypothetical protein
MGTGSILGGGESDEGNSLMASGCQLDNAFFAAGSLEAVWNSYFRFLVLFPALKPISDCMRNPVLRIIIELIQFPGLLINLVLSAGRQHQTTKASYIIEV